MRFLLGGPSRTGMLHADPHPGNYRVIPNDDGSPGRLGVPRLRRRGAASRAAPLPRGDGHADPDRRPSHDGGELLEGLRNEGFVRPDVKIDPRPEPHQYLDAVRSSRPA